MKLYYEQTEGTKKLEVVVDYDPEEKEWDLVSATISDGEKEIDMGGLLDWGMVDTIDWEKIYKKHLQLKSESELDEPLYPFDPKNIR